MSTTYEVIKKIEDDTNFLILLNKGVIPISVLDKKVYYERYLHEFKTIKNKWQAIINASEEFNVSEMTIRRAIRFMEN